MMMALLSMVANAQCGVEINGIHYQLSDDENTAKVFNIDYLWEPVWTYEGDIVIPPTIEYQGVTYHVTTIGNMAFWNSDITSISIPNSVKIIENGAFRNCESLTSLTIPEGVEYLGDIWCSKLASLTLPSSLEHCGHIGSSILKTLVLPDNLKYFGGCSAERLRSLTIPNSVEYVGSLFCANLTSITFGNGIKEMPLDAFNNCAWYDNLPDGVVYIGSLLFGYKGKMPANTNLSIKEGTKTINPRAFQGNARSESNPEDYSGLKSVTIPNTLTSIGEAAFSGCENLASITIPSSVNQIGWGAFDGTAWLKKQSNGVVYAGNVLYSYKGSMPDNTKIVVKDGTVSITDGAFAGTIGLTSITIPQSVKYIGKSAFGGCDELPSIILPNGITSIEENCFEGCSSLTSIDIPNTVTSIGRQAFSNCIGFTSIDIPNGVISIGEDAFYGCGLTSVTIPSSVKSMSFRAFGEPTDVDVINITDLAAWCDISFSSRELNGRKLSVNGVIVNDLVIPSGVERIRNNAFSGCSNLTSVSIPNSVIWIGSYVFNECPSLKSVMIGNSVKRIASGTFAYCGSLKNVYCYSKNPPVAFYFYTGENNDNVYGNSFDDSLMKTMTLYAPKISLNTYRSTDPWKLFGNIKILAGDVNGDGIWDSKDITEIANSIMGNPSDGFDKDAADLNGDGVVDVADLVVLSNIILEQN